MNVLVVGGTGFLGYHAVKEFVRRGHTVSILALPPMPAEGLFPDGVHIQLANLDELSDVRVRALLRGMQGVVFAAGADDRIIPKAPAYPFFHHANVEVSARLFRLAREEGVQRGALLSSYFLHFERIWPELKLAEHHPYIRSRKEQEQQALRAAMPDLQLCILELPYIFGSMPGRAPLWTPIVNLVRRSRVILYPPGGTNMIAVQHVAEAIVGAIEQGKGGERYVVGDENLTWVDWLRRLSRLACGKAKPVVTIPRFLMRMQMRQVQKMHRAEGKEGGLDPIELVKLQCAQTFFDPTPAAQALGYGRGGLDEALSATVEASPVGGNTTFW